MRREDYDYTTLLEEADRERERERMDMNDFDLERVSINWEKHRMCLNDPEELYLLSLID